MLQLFKTYNPIVIVLLLILAGALSYNSFLGIQPFSDLSAGGQMPLYKLIASWIQSQPNWVSITVMLVLITIQIFIFTTLDFRFSITHNKSFLVAFIFLLLVLSFPSLNVLLPAHFANVLILMGINKIFQAVTREKAHYIIFDSSLYFSIASLFYFYSYFLFAFVIIALIITRKFYFREWIISILGFITPYIFLYAIWYILKGEIFNLPQFIDISLIHLNKIIFNTHTIIYYSILLFYILIGSYVVISILPTISIANRNYFKLFFWLFLLSVIILFIHPGASFQLFIVMTIPLSILFATSFQHIKSKWWNEILFITLIGSIIILNIKMYS